MGSRRVPRSAAKVPGYLDTTTGFTLIMSGMDLPAEAVAGLTREGSSGKPSPLAAAHEEMKQIEDGAIKNPDEKRKVTHFTDRLAYPKTKLCRQVESFARGVRKGAVRPAGKRVDAVIVNGIGGSALGPQLVQFALNGPYWNELSRKARDRRPRIYFVDNTDPAGIVDLRPVLDLARTVVVTVSKGGSTQETVNNMRAFEQAFTADGLNFADHAVAVTMKGSDLHRRAKKDRWCQIFPMAESIGGRTSVTNIVGHLPAALTGIDFAGLLAGACHMDELTRAPALAENPAYQLAASWYIAGNGKGDRNMVIVPYSDRLVLLGKYLQQLVMESLGKRKDLSGRVVEQGITVYGNKGGTDAHSYIQQLQDGRNDFFVTFIEILRDAAQIEVDDGSTMGDHLHAFKEGLVNALRRKRRQVIEIVLESLDAFSLGMLVALYERAVAVYAELVHINAFNQPGVKLYKEASGRISEVSVKLRAWIATAADWQGTAAGAARAAGTPRRRREVEGLLAKFAVNERRFGGVGISRKLVHGEWQYTLSG